MIKQIFLLAVGLFLLSTMASAQKKNEKGVTGFLVNVTYAGHLPSGDFAERYGPHFSVGLGSQYLTSKNWLFGADVAFLFGGTIKEDVLAIMRTSEGEIIGQSKEFVPVSLNQGGFITGFTLGKVIPVFNSNGISGIRISLNAGVMQHRIRINDNGAVPQLAGEYRKGYDRLTNGLSLTQFIGYQYLSDNKRINFFLGFEFTQAFTQSRRSFNYDTQAHETGQRLDLLNGFRIGWILPIYTGSGLSDFF